MQILIYKYKNSHVVYYVATWVFAAFAIQILFKPDALTESNVSDFQQRIHLFLYTPVIATVGLAEAFVWPKDYSLLISLVAAGCLIVHAVVTFMVKNFHSFVMMIIIQAALLTVAVIYFIRFSRLPSGG